MGESTYFKAIHPIKGEGAHFYSDSGSTVNVKRGIFSNQQGHSYENQPKMTCKAVFINSIKYTPLIA